MPTVRRGGVRNHLWLAMVNPMGHGKVVNHLIITEEKLMTRVGFFTDEQVAEILGVKVDDLQYEHTQIKRAQPANKKKSK